MTKKDHNDTPEYDKLIAENDKDETKLLDSSIDGSSFHKFKDRYVLPERKEDNAGQ